MVKIFIGDPFVIQFNLCKKCILKCPYCYLKNIKDEYLKFDDLKKILLKFEKWSKIYNFKLQINLTGGDLWLHPDIEKICKFVYAQDCVDKISLLINNLWHPKSKKIISAIKDKIDLVQINIDVIKGREKDILFLKREKIKTVTKIMLSKNNDIKKQIKIGKDFKKIYNNIFIAVDRFCPTNRQDYKYVLETKELVGLVKKIRNDFPFFINDDPLLNALLKDKKEHAEFDCINYCIVPNGGMSIYPNGEIKLCSRMPNYKTGFNVGNFDLIKYIKNFSFIRKRIKTICNNCGLFDVCGGGCLASSFSKNNKISKDINCLNNRR